MRRTVVIAIGVVLLGAGSFLLYFLRSNNEKPEPLPLKGADNLPQQIVIGSSVEGRSINGHSYGNGKTHLVFVGGMHGGYEWNSVLLAYSLMDYLEENPKNIPSSLKITVIPSVNPDGVFKVIGKEGRFAVSDVPTDIDESPGRFNANGVDLNRNFDCKWQSKGTWKGKTVSAGTGPFSEPESRAIRDFMLETKPTAVVFWHSQANAVYASECKNGILPETLKIMNAYALASNYSPVKSFDSYVVTGDAEGWLASIGIPAITVELETHRTIEWDRNLNGIKALFVHYNQKVEAAL